MRILALLAALTALSHVAHADDSFASTVASRLPLVNINTEAFPDQTYVMGYDLDANNNLIGLYYNDPNQAIAANQMRDFSFADLALAPQILITRTTLGTTYDVVNISYVPGKLTILFQKDARQNVWSNKVYNVACNASNSSCTVADGDTGVDTSNIYITSHRARILLINTVVGIDAIESR